MVALHQPFLTYMWQRRPKPLLSISLLTLDIYGGMLSLFLSPTTSVDVSSTAGTNAADDALFACALDLDRFFPTDSQTVSNPGKGTHNGCATKSTQQLKPISKVSQSSRICPPDESIQQLKLDSNIKQSKPHGKRHKGVTVPLISKKLPAALEVHHRWDYAGAALLNESEFSTSLICWTIFYLPELIIMLQKLDNS